MQMSKGKWTKYILMKDDEELSLYLPETKQLTEEALWEFLEKYNDVIIKPSRGHYGRGVVKVTALGEDQYEIHYENKKVTLTGKNETFDCLKENYLQKRLNIVQQRVRLASINGCPFDLRVMVQRKTDSTTWVITGIAAKVASAGFIVTNIAKKILPAETALEQAGLKEIDLIINRIHLISLTTAERLQEFYPERRSFGIDIGLDQNGGIWIIEVNVLPTISLFKFLEDQTIYERIKNYKG